MARKYIFLTNCVGWNNGEDINEMKAGSERITRRQFLAQVDPEQMREKEVELGYFAWSGIEYIFVDPSEWRR